MGSGGRGGATLGVLMAGGRSRRFGEAKAGALFRGVPMAEGALEKLRLVCDSVGAVAADPGEIPGWIPDGDLEIRGDDPRGRGPLGGLRTALRWARDEGRDGILVLAVDLPLVPDELLAALVEVGEGEGATAVLPRSPGPRGFEPLCAWYGVEFLSAVEAALAGPSGAVASAIEALRRSGGEVRWIDSPELDSLVDPSTMFLNVNTPGDLERAAGMQAGRNEPGAGGRRRRDEAMPGAEDQGLSQGRREGRVPTVCVVGRKNSGKTNLTIQLLAELNRRGHRALSAKHGHGFELDSPGTDSWGHRHHGGAARVALVGPDSMAVMGDWGPEGEPPLEEVVQRFLSDADVVVAEGFKASRAPRIEVYRTGLSEGPLLGPNAEGPERWLALVTDDPALLTGSLPCPAFALDRQDLVARLADLVEQAVMGLAPGDGGGT